MSTVPIDKFSGVNQMAQLPETLSMDRRGISFAKKQHFTISKNVAILVLVVFLACVAVTAALTYFLTAQADDERCDRRVENALSLKLPEVPKMTTTMSLDEDDQDDGTTTMMTSTEETLEVGNGTKVIKDVRLPTNIIPVNYDLRILTLMHNFTFVGSVTIRVQVVEEGNNVTLHVNKLEVPCDDVQAVMEESLKVQPVKECTIDKELEFFVIHFEDDLKKGFYNVSLNFSGVLRDELSGFYRSSYKKGEDTRWLAATQFQPTDARSAFPCFDEPSLKATFQITIGRPSNYSAISNMPLVSSNPHATLDGFTWDEFQRSVPMSTYLVAFIVSDFKSRTIGNFSLYARESALNQTAVAVELGPKFLSFLEKYFDIPFPLPKMDLAAIPDFSAGAMENWGLITFRESNLLYEEGVSSKRNLQRIAIVIAHELGHQWFGNLVTPSWWSDLWLNEGFASYLEFITTDAVHPEWKMLDQFVVEDLQTVFALDALKSSHPISVVVNNPNEINDIFDRISYEKGATIIRMMDDFLSTETFRKGLTNYLNEMKYKSAQQDDLWDALTKQARRDKVLTDNLAVKDVMDTWTLQMGFPLVTINRTSGEDGIEVRVTQEKFSLNRVNTSEYTWWIPLTYQARNGSMGRQWLPQKNRSCLIEVNATEDDWVIFNVNQTGYYRVNYDAKGWELVGRQLMSDHKVFDPKNRAQMMNDALSLSSAGYLDYGTSLNLTRYLRSEREYVPWKAAISNLQYLYEMFQRSGHFDVFRDYLLNLVQPLYEDLGFEEARNDSLLKTYVRGIVVSNACRLGFADCVRRAMTQFENWMLAPNPDAINTISPNLKGIIYCTAVEIGGERSWKFVWERYLNANVGTERELLMSALGCAREPWLLNKYMSMALSGDSGIKKQDVIFVFRAVGKNIVGQSVGFRFVTSRWDEINKYMGKAIVTTNGILTAVTSNMNTEKELEELKTFARKYVDDESFSQRNAQQIIEQTEANIAWMKNYFDGILEWMKAYSKEVSVSN